MAARFGAIDGVEIVGEAEESGAALAGVDATDTDVVVVDFRLTSGTSMELLHSLALSTSPGDHHCADESFERGIQAGMPRGRRAVLLRQDERI
jgi:DNA-binding NarL/FixJ family response regulator